MEVVFAIPIILIPLVFPLIGGLMAQSFGRSFWFWFWVSIFLPFITYIILLCLPDKKIKRETVVQDEELLIGCL